MKILLIGVTCCVLTYCASLGGQSTSGTFSGNIATSSRWDCPKGQHYEGPTIWRMVCVKDDGAPPRWVPDDVICLTSLGWNCVTSHWECDKGYELDGFNISWEEGVFHAKPIRCKAEK